MRCDDSVNLREFETENAMQWRWRFEGIDDEEYGFEGIGDGKCRDRVGIRKLRTGNTMRCDAMAVSIDLRELT
jgi:hypothetical protein